MFDSPQTVEAICYDLKLSDYSRALDRALVNRLFNGFPPYTAEEVEENQVRVNVNDLSSTVLGHDARSQFYGAFLKPGNYFQMRTDAGPKHKRQKWNAIVTKELGKMMKASLPYFEKHRSTFASDVLHGIGPGAWENRDDWCSDPLGIEDVGIPAKTLVTMKNLPFFYLYRSYTANQLKKFAQAPKLDKAWNKPLLNSCLEWIDQEATKLMGNRWPEMWSPEKMQERIKGDGGFYASDEVPSIDTFDFYYYDDAGKHSGWRRRIILDAWSTPQGTGGLATMSKRSGSLYDHKGEFLYDSGERVYADHWQQIMSFQFADLSAVAPFQYHSVRSLGFLLYAACNLQNRMRCKFNEAVFEALLMYFRVRSMDEAQRALKVELANRGFIDESLQFIPANERWQVNANLVELGLTENQRIIQQNSSSYVTQARSNDRTEKTKFQVMSEINTATSLVSAALIQAYHYQKFEYEEIKRRFLRKHSRNPDVKLFRAACMKQQVPEEVLVPECWEAEPERVMGAGNKTLEMAISEQLLQMRPLYDPEPQRKILRDITLAITDDPARAEDLVPEQPHISDSIHDGQLAAGTLMQGLPVAVKSGINHQEYIEALLADLMLIVQQGKASGGMLSPEKIKGVQNLAKHITDHLKILAQDKSEKARVKRYGDMLGKLMNDVRAFAQRLAEQMKKQQGNGQPQMDPKDMAKIQAIQMQAQAKAENTKQSHAQRTAQRQLQWELEQKRKEEEHQLDLRRKSEEGQIDVRLKDLEAAGNITRNRFRSLGD